MERACSSLAHSADDVMVLRNTVLKVRNRSGQVCSCSKEVHIREVRTKLRSQTGMIKEVG